MGETRQVVGACLASMFFVGALGAATPCAFGQNGNGAEQGCNAETPKLPGLNAPIAPCSPGAPCPAAVVKPLGENTQPKSSLGSVSFVGDIDSLEGEGYAIMPLMHGSTVEVYNLDGECEPLAMPPIDTREMAENEIYVLRMPKSPKAVCVTVKGQKRCWRPGKAFDGNFLRWASSRGGEN